MSQVIVRGHHDYIILLIQLFVVAVHQTLRVLGRGENCRRCRLQALHELVAVVWLLHALYACPTQRLHRV